MKGMIVVHGTSQDRGSAKETTVQIANAARAAGHFVIDIGGPGSTERSILRGMERNPLLAQYTPIDEIGFPADYWWDLLSGTLVGAGIDDIVRDTLAAMDKMVQAGVSSIDLVGFSRGAVAVALALQEVGRSDSKLKIRVPVKACLLDPVPGPGVPTHVEIPPLVSEIMVLVSKHEGRPGFNKLNLTMGEGVNFTGDLIMGVHGDIGGSTESLIVGMVKDRVVRFFGLPAYRLTSDARLALTLMIIANARRYTSPGLFQMMSRRAIGWSDQMHELAPENIELPSAHSGEEALRASSQDWQRAIDRYDDQVRVANEARWLERQIERFQQQQRWERGNQGVVVPARPVVGSLNRVIYPPSSFHSGQSRLGKAFTGALRRLFRK